MCNMSLSKEYNSVQKRPLPIVFSVDFLLKIILRHSYRIIVIKTVTYVTCNTIEVLIHISECNINVIYFALLQKSSNIFPFFCIISTFNVFLISHLLLFDDWAFTLDINKFIFGNFSVLEKNNQIYFIYISSIQQHIFFSIKGRRFKIYVSFATNVRIELH